MTTNAVVRNALERAGQTVTKNMPFSSDEEHDRVLKATKEFLEEIVRFSDAFLQKFGNMSQLDDMSIDVRYLKHENFNFALGAQRDVDKPLQVALSLSERLYSQVEKIKATAQSWNSRL